MAEFPGDRAHRENRPNVLLVAHAAARFLFGGERLFLQILRGLNRLQVNTFVTLPRHVAGYTERIRRQSERVFVFDYAKWQAGLPLSDQATARFGQIIGQHGIHAVHANTITTRECLAAARQCRVQAVCHVHELVTHDPFILDVLGETADSVIASVHARADWIIANSRATLRAFASPGRSFLVRNTIDMEELDLPNPIGPGVIRFGLISSNIPKKGLSDFIEVARLAQARSLPAAFVVIGPDTPHVQMVKAQAKEGALPGNIEFAGYLPLPQAAIGRVNVVLNLSSFSESFGLTVLEAMTARRPVIGYDWGAMPELIRHGETGFLAPFRNLGAVSGFVEKLCAERRLLQTLGERARCVALQEFGADMFLRGLRDAYRTILPDARFPDPPARNSAMA